MEIFDIVTADGTPTGQTTSRENAHAKGICHRTAHIWIARMHEGRKQVLLQKRSMIKDSFPGDYDTSSAGHIQAGDEPLESALRELEEELGIKAEPRDLEFAGIFHVSYEEEFYGKMFRDNEVAFVYAYCQPVDISKLVLQEEEVEAVEWFDLEEVYRECMTGTRKSGNTEKGAGRFCVPTGGLLVIRDFLRKKYPYQFYGWDQATVPVLPDAGLKGIKTPQDLYDALLTIWCEYTCAPRLRGSWSKEKNITCGQCSITGFLTQDIFGGKVYGVLRPGGNYHCYNVIDGHKFDLTSEQFADEVLDYDDNPEQLRQVHFAKEEKRFRYEWLKAKLYELYS